MRAAIYCLEHGKIDDEYLGRNYVTMYFTLPHLQKLLEIKCPTCGLSESIVLRIEDTPVLVDKKKGETNEQHNN